MNAVLKRISQSLNKVGVLLAVLLTVSCAVNEEENSDDNDIQTCK